MSISNSVRASRCLRCQCPYLQSPFKRLKLGVAARNQSNHAAPRTRDHVDDNDRYLSSPQVPSLKDGGSEHDERRSGAIGSRWGVETAGPVRMSFLGTPGEILVLPERSIQEDKQSNPPRSSLHQDFRTSDILKQHKVDGDTTLASTTSSGILEVISQEGKTTRDEDVYRNIDNVRSDANAFASAITEEEKTTIRNTLVKGFTAVQLQRYIEVRSAAEAGAMSVSKRSNGGRKKPLADTIISQVWGITTKDTTKQLKVMKDQLRLMLMYRSTMFSYWKRAKNVVIDTKVETGEVSLRGNTFDVTAVLSDMSRSIRTIVHRPIAVPLELHGSKILDPLLLFSRQSQEFISPTLAQTETVLSQVNGQYIAYSFSAGKIDYLEILLRKAAGEIVGKSTSGPVSLIPLNMTSNQSMVPNSSDLEGRKKEVYFRCASTDSSIQTMLVSDFTPVMKSRFDLASSALQSSILDIPLPTTNEGIEVSLHPMADHLFSELTFELGQAVQTSLEATTPQSLFVSHYPYLHQYLATLNDVKHDDSFWLTSRSLDTIRNLSLIYKSTLPGNPSIKLLVTSNNNNWDIQEVSLLLAEHSKALALPDTPFDINVRRTDHHILFLNGEKLNPEYVPFFSQLAEQLKLESKKGMPRISEELQLDISSVSHPTANTKPSSDNDASLLAKYNLLHADEVDQSLHHTPMRSNRVIESIIYTDLRRWGSSRGSLRLTSLPLFHHPLSATENRKRVADLKAARTAADQASGASKSQESELVKDDFSLNMPEASSPVSPALPGLSAREQMELESNRAKPGTKRKTGMSVAVLANGEEIWRYSPIGSDARKFKSALANAWDIAVGYTKIVREQEMLTKQRMREEVEMVERKQAETRFEEM